VILGAAPPARKDVDDDGTATAARTISTMGMVGLIWRFTLEFARPPTLPYARSKVPEASIRGAEHAIV